MARTLTSVSAVSRLRVDLDRVANTALNARRLSCRIFLLSLSERVGCPCQKTQADSQMNAIIVCYSNNNNKINVHLGTTLRMTECGSNYTLVKRAAIRCTTNNLREQLHALTYVQRTLKISSTGHTKIQHT